MYPFILLSAAAFTLSVFSFIYLKSYLKRRTGQERILKEFREEVYKILGTIDETTDRDISLIEEKENSLKSLLEETDRRLKVFIRETEKRKSADEAYAALQQKIPPAPPYEELGRNRYKVEAASAAESAFPLPPFRVKAQDTPESAENPPEAASASPENVPSMGVQIHDLVKSGLAPPVIASRLGISIAEVEFAAALLERRAQSDRQG